MWRQVMGDCANPSLQAANAKYCPQAGTCTARCAPVLMVLCIVFFILPQASIRRKCEREAGSTAACQLWPSHVRIFTARVRLAAYESTGITSLAIMSIMSARWVGEHGRLRVGTPNHEWHCLPKRLAVGPVAWLKVGEAAEVALRAPIPLNADWNGEPHGGTDFSIQDSSPSHFGLLRYRFLANSFKYTCFNLHFNNQEGLESPTNAKIWHRLQSKLSTRASGLCL
jgi:hypothetical protein